MIKVENFEDYKKYSQLGAELYNRKDYKKALQVFTELVRVNYDNFKLHETLSYIYLKLNDVPKAEEEFKIATEIARRTNGTMEKPRTFEDLVQEAGDIKKVETDFVNVMKESDSKVLLHSKTAIHLGILYMAKGQYKKAEEVLSQYRDRCVSAIG